MDDNLNPTKEMALDVLSKAREVIADDRFWVARQFCASTPEGGTVGVCALGAIAIALPNKTMPTKEYSEGHPHVQAYAKFLDARSAQDPMIVPRINDNQGRDAILAKFDAAIAKLTAETTATFTVEAGKVTPKLAATTGVGACGGDKDKGGCNVFEPTPLPKSK